jgi:mersacidin/lichenicidin family type 2 lantibiotic
MAAVIPQEVAMTIQQIVRAWTDPAYRASLSDAERQALPENPAGMIDLTGTALDLVAGGGGSCKSRKKSKKRGGSSGSSGSKSGSGGRKGKGSGGSS